MLSDKQGYFFSFSDVEKLAKVTCPKPCNCEVASQDLSSHLCQKLAGPMGKSLGTNCSKKDNWLLSNKDWFFSLC